MKEFKNEELKSYNFNMNEIKIFDSFAGIGALHQSLKELGIPIKLVGLSEVDIDAIISYGGVHNIQLNKILTSTTTDEMRKYLTERNIGYDFKTNKSKVPKLNKDKLKLCYNICVATNNLGDISKLDYDNIPDFDLFNMSFPCTDISIAGQQKGMIDEEGKTTRSGLYTYGIRVIKAKKPKYIMIENVKNLISKSFVHNFYDIINEIELLGYKCYYPNKEDKKGNKIPTCLNGKNYGIPQNRERIFVICVRNDIDDGLFEFPQGFDNGTRLKDILEEDIDDKYYLSNIEIDKIFNWKAYQRPLEKVLGNNSISPTLTARGAGEYHSGMILLSENFNDITNVDKIIVADYRYDEGLRVRKEEISPCLTCKIGGKSLSANTLIISKDKINSLKIRKLSPKESWRLMGFKDKCFDRAKQMGVSDSQLYKQAGNSIIVNVLYYIFKELFKQYII